MYLCVVLINENITQTVMVIPLQLMQIKAEYREL